MKPLEERGFNSIFEAMADGAESLSHLGVCLWRGVFLHGGGSEEEPSLDAAADLCDWWKKFSRNHRVPRVSRALFPLPSVWGDDLKKFPLHVGLNGVVRDRLLGEQFGEFCWCELAVVFLNHLYNATLGFGPQEVSLAQEEFLRAIQGSVHRWLVEDITLNWGIDEVLKDFSKKTISYTGEEICKAEPLSVYRVSPALPPEGHGGSISCTDWVSGSTKWYLENPRSCLVADTGQELPRLQAKVHIVPGEEKALAELLVRRNICRWVEEDRVVEYRGQKVFNGLFGVPKSTVLANHQTSLRCIMNLIPSNAILRSIPGRVDRLPSVMQWMHICLDAGETVSICQNDMVSAFYLFRIPEEWSELLAFGLKFKGDELGFEGAAREKSYYLSCQVLPMGWSSAVGVTQQIAEEVLHRGGLPTDEQIVRGQPIPPWMVQVCRTAEDEKRSWWHVYLDNFACGEKLRPGQRARGRQRQLRVEELWDRAGILSSSSKVVSEQPSATELGAFIGGEGHWIGAGPERMLKLAKSTLFLMARKQIPKKMLQILMGRWVFAMQFRRPFMSHFEQVWKVFGEKRERKPSGDKLRRELLLGLFGMSFLHTWMLARVDDEITCSDASMTGGAIAVSRELSDTGQAMLTCQEGDKRATVIPVVLISLFNGIGGASRSYDLAGVKVKGVIFADTHKPANRIYNRRWPGGYGFSDVRDLKGQALEDCLMALEPFEEIHVWAGFPCVDLSSVRAYRQNLEGPSSGLIHEARRVLGEARQLYPAKKVRHVVENVASMDIEARDEISRMMGAIPYKLDPSMQVPMSRPRFCWTDVEVFPTAEVRLIPQEGYIQLEVIGDWPAEETWLDANCEQMQPGVIFPTCMKAIRRDRPPSFPAGINRTDPLTRERWESDEFRYPPYQYKEQYLIWDEKVGSCRLLNSNERELLMGYGSSHTSLAFSASKAKSNKTDFEDERCSLLGDSFSIYSFMVIAAYAAYPWMKTIRIEQMNQRTGLQPGASLNLDFTWPLGHTLPPDCMAAKRFSVDALNLQLLRRTDHTGSDVRIVTGEILNKKCFPRESVQSQWWKWRQVFNVHWSQTEQINALEARSIYLSLLWKARERHFCNRRLFHLTDSYVAMSILAKGRTSSFALQPIVRKVSALLLGGSAWLILGHVDSADNPTDEGSRRTAKSTPKKATRTHGLRR